MNNSCYSRRCVFLRKLLGWYPWAKVTTSHWANWQYRANKVKQVPFHFFCFRLSKSCSSGSSVSFVVGNGAEYYNQINMTALWDELKKKSLCCKVNKGLRIFFFWKEGFFPIQNPKVLEIKCCKTELLLSENRFPTLFLEGGITENTFKSKLNKGFSFFWHTAYC